jgi:hypothetical protein
MSKVRQKVKKRHEMGPIIIRASALFLLLAV